MYSEEGRALSPPSLAGYVSRFSSSSSTSDLILMHVGLPSSCSFPLSHLKAGKGDESLIDMNGQDLAAAQQYCFSHGHKDLVDWVKSFMQAKHQPSVPTDVVITAGAVNGISNIISVLADRGAKIIVDTFSYTHVTESLLSPRGMELLPVGSDQGGMVPSELEALLSSSETDGSPPRILYAIPTGHNPIGFTMSLERKKQIYDICAKYGVLIIEDDAYYWLQWSDDGVPGSSLPPSFLSIDTDSRVIRVDTFSKLLGPGYRIGWVTCHPTLALKIGQSIQGQSVGAASVSMAMISSILKSWGNQGFDDFLKSTQLIYRGRAMAAIEATASQLSDESGRMLARIAIPPKAGMFLWVELLVDFDDQTEELISKAFLDQRVVALPGSLFRVSKSPSLPCPFIRVSFGGMDEDKIREGFKRIGAALRSLRPRV